MTNLSHQHKSAERPSSKQIGMADVQDDSLALRERLQSLPQELYDYIYKLTFTADSRVRCLAEKKQHEDASSVHSRFSSSDDFSATFDVKPYPQDPLFYVDRASRNLYAASYFNSVAVLSPFYFDRFGNSMPFSTSFLLGFVQ